MLQFVLADLFDASGRRRHRRARDERRGSLSGVIGARAEEILVGPRHERSAEVRRAVRRARHAGRGSLRHPPAGQVRRAHTQAMQAVVEPFVAGRLLVADHDQADARADSSRSPTRHSSTAGRGCDRGSTRIVAGCEQLQHLAGGGAELARGRAPRRASCTAGRGPGSGDRGVRERAATLNDTEVAFITAGQAHRDLNLDRERRTSSKLRRLLAGAWSRSSWRWSRGR